MDKAQKQLIDTYFRKRKIANDSGVESLRGSYSDNTIKYIDSEIQNSFGLYHTFELKYLVDKNIIDVNSLDIEIIKFLISEYPEYADKLKNEIFVKFNVSQIARFIIDNPKLINKIDVEKEFSYIGGSDNKRRWYYEAAYILENRPELIKYFPVNEFSSRFIDDILRAQPQLAKYFK